MCVFVCAVGTFFMHIILLDESRTKKDLLKFNGDLCRLFHITPGADLGGLFPGISSAALLDGKWKEPPKTLVLSEKQRGTLEAPEL